MSSQKKRIALVTAFPPGTQTLNEYGLHMAKGFAERDDVSEIIILADKTEGPVQELDLGPKVQVQRVWNFNSVGSQLRLLGAIRRAKADLVLFNLQTAGFGDREIPAATGLCLPLMARLMGQTSGLVLHNVIAGIDLEQTLLKGQRVRQWMVRTAGKIVTRALLGATYVTTTLPGYYDFLRSVAPRANLAMVPHGTFEVGENIQPPSTRSPRLNTMGKFGTYKRLETLISAFKKLRKNSDFADLELEIGGRDHPNTPGYMEQLEKTYANEPGLNFLGYVGEDDVPDFFGRAQISVFDYSTTTGSSGVLHQAAAYGTVPVFPDIDDFVDVAKGEGLRGYHYAPNDVNSMAVALGTALRAGQELDNISQNNLAAAGHMPFSKVIDYHMRRLSEFSRNGASKSASTSSHADTSVSTS